MRKISIYTTVIAAFAVALSAGTVIAGGPKTSGHQSILTAVINADPQEQLVHLADGNFNGPVGLAAALAQADYAYGIAVNAHDAAIKTFEMAAAFALIANAPTDQDITAARALTNSAMAPPTAAEIADAKAIISMGRPSKDAVAAAEADILADYIGVLHKDDAALILAKVRQSFPSTDEIAAVLAKNSTIFEEANGS